VSRWPRGLCHVQGVNVSPLGGGLMLRPCNSQNRPFLALWTCHRTPTGALAEPSVNLAQEASDGTMDAMSDVGVIVTGVLVGSASGIIGTICGAWLTARSQMSGLMLQITAEDQRAKIADKRRVYADFHAALDNLIIGNQSIRDSWETSSQDERAAIRSKADTALVALFSAQSAVKLTAPKSIGEKADKLAGLMVGETEPLLFGEMGGWDESGDDFLEQRSKLYRAMRADLGTSSLSPSLEKLLP
jgi:hypothetical protein